MEDENELAERTCPKNNLRENPTTMTMTTNLP